MLPTCKPLILFITIQHYNYTISGMCWLTTLSVAPMRVYIPSGLVYKGYVYIYIYVVRGMYVCIYIYIDTYIYIYIYIYKGGVQWKQGVVIYMMLDTS